MKFKVGDVVEIDHNAGINHGSRGDKEIAYDLSDANWTIIAITPEHEHLLLDGADNQEALGYDQSRFKLVEPRGGWFATDEEADELADGYYEPCSTYRACTDSNGNWVVEAVRVKVICRCADGYEAERIANALEQTKDNFDV